MSKKICKIYELNYKGLCELMGEEQKIGKARTLQFERWKKEYSIEKQKGYTYKIKPLTESQKIKINGYIKYNKIVEPMILEALSYDNSEELICSMLELQKLFGFINDNFIAINKSKTALEGIAEMLGISTEELDDYKIEVYKILSRTIKNVLNDMQQKDLIIVYDKYRITYKLDDGTEIIKLADDKLTQQLLNKTNELAQLKYNDNYYNLSYRDKIKIKEEVNAFFHIMYHEKVKHIIKSNGAIKYYLNKNFNYLDNKRTTNELTQIKIMKSKQGKLKEIPKYKKGDITDKVITIED